ncbi:hypothetical protein JCM10207_004472, partial [Rhodosporidiobolus poonsookiae]
MPPRYSPLDPNSASDLDDLPPPPSLAHTARPDTRALRAPRVLVPDPFSDKEKPHSHAHSLPDGHKLEQDRDDDADDSLSEASSVTAGRASAELTRYKSEWGAGFDDDGEGDGDDSGEDRGLLGRSGGGRDGAAPALEEGAWTGHKREQRGRRRRLLIVLLLSSLLLLPLLLLVLHSLAVALFPTSTYASVHRHRFEGKGLRKMSREELRNGTWWVERVELEWLKEAGDGTFSQRADDGSILLTDLAKNESRVLVQGDDVKDARTGQRLDWSTFAVSPDMQYILFGSDWKKQWRHSSLQHFHLHRLSPPLTLLLSPPPSSAPPSIWDPPLTSLAHFAPTSHTLALVHANDVLVFPAEAVDAVFAQADREGGGEGAARRAKAWEGAVRVTEDGEKSVRENGGEVEAGTVFNGVNDWVYEEEVFSRPSALFFSPTASHLAFLSFDESAVPLFDFPVYSDKDLWERPGGGADEYPGRRAMRYPKAGYPNPLVTIRLFSLSAFLSAPASRPSLPSSSSPSVTPGVEAHLSTLVLDRPFPADDVVVAELAWVGERELVVRATSRDAAVERVGLFEVGEEGEGEEVRGRTVRETDWVEKDGGWAEIGQTISPLLPSSPSLSSAAPLPAYPKGYLDVLPSPSGHLHLAYFSPPDAAEPVWLTGGEWEIDGGVQRVDLGRGVVYFLAARPSIERHLYSVPLPRSQSALDALKRDGPGEPTPLTDLTLGAEAAKGRERTRGTYGVSFSPGGGVYLLNYEGPDVPWQKVLKVDEPDFSLTLTNNSRLSALDEAHQRASVRYSSLALPGAKDPATGELLATREGGKALEVNVAEMRPPTMDVSGRTKYPVLVQV